MFFTKNTPIITPKNAKIGARVVLVNPDPGYGIGPANPLINTKFECTGYITKISHLTIHVSWTNRSTNVYKSGELREVTNGVSGSNGVGNYLDIWENI